MICSWCRGQHLCSSMYVSLGHIEKTKQNKKWVEIKISITMSWRVYAGEYVHGQYAKSILLRMSKYRTKAKKKRQQQQQQSATTAQHLTWFIVFFNTVLYLNHVWFSSNHIKTCNENNTTQKPKHYTSSSACECGVWDF